MNNDTRSRFEEKCMLGKNGCIEWTGAKASTGYGRFWINDGMNYAHRAAWIIYNGPIPKEIQVLHHCDNPGCVNTKHLFLGTVSDNMKDKVQKKRHYHKITEEQTRRIVSEYKPGGKPGPHPQSNSYNGLAIKYGVSISTIWYAINGYKSRVAKNG